MESDVFLDSAESLAVQPVYVLHGDEDFLKRQAILLLRNVVLGGEDEGFGLSNHAGDKATFAEVHDELETMPFLGSRRLVIVDNADPFVTQFRSLLEKYVGQPSALGVLVLDVKIWPANTRLAKLLAGKATITCKALARYQLPAWCTRWARKQYGKQLPAEAAGLLVDLVGEDMGQLDQEIAKLAVYVGAAGGIEASDVDKIVGNSRAEKVWEIFEAIGKGQAHVALTILDRLFEQGEDRMRLLGAFSMQLRRLAQIARMREHGESLSRAMYRAGVPPFAQRGCEQQLEYLGDKKAARFYDWLLDTDLGLKGSSALPDRTILERLVVQLARRAEVSENH
jgi:DNA polymerase-3 subunit delta